MHLQLYRSQITLESFVGPTANITAVKVAIATASSTIKFNMDTLS